MEARSQLVPISDAQPPARFISRAQGKQALSLYGGKFEGISIKEAFVAKL